MLRKFSTCTAYSKKDGFTVQIASQIKKRNKLYPKDCANLEILKEKDSFLPLMLTPLDQLGK
jgi:hypothetical protein